MQPESTAFLFPGQGSQEVGMGYQLAQEYPTARDTFLQADEILGYSLSQITWEGPENKLNDTINTQPALLTHSIAVLRIFETILPGFRPAYVAGHSMGELSALVAAKTANFEQILTLTRKRGELMKKAGEISPGGMAAILALDLPTMEAICEQASTPAAMVQIANDNCPGQVVISGHTKALETAMRLARKAKARKVVRLAVSIAAHSPLMATIQNEFNQALEETSITDPQIPIVGNLTAQPMFTAREILSDLRAQLESRVKWTDTIEYMISKGVDTFVEIGSGDVLTGLVKRIHRRTKRISVGNPEAIEKLQTFTTS
jgi:[acyl-carrier-protein] S-malonyltransferase